MTALPLSLAVLVVGAVLVAVLLLVVLRRRRSPAVPAGPRTVAELVELRAAANPTRVSAPVPVEPVVEAEAVEAPAPAAPAPAAAAAPPPAPATPAPAGRPAPVGEPVALLGDDVPWRRAALMDLPRTALPGPRSATATARAGRVGRALSGSTRRDRRAAGTERAATRAATVPAPAPAPDALDTARRDGADPRAADAPAAVRPRVVDPPRSGSSARSVRERGADTAPVAGAVPGSPVAEASAAAPSVSAPSVSASGSSASAAPAPPEPVAEPAALPEPAAPVPAPAPAPVVDPPSSGSSARVARIDAVPARRPATAPPSTSLRPTAEQAAADLALLRTFGAVDLASRPDRAPDVALASTARPEPEPAPGPAQPVRFRVVRRGGEPIADAAVALLDAAGRETATAHGPSGELTAPRPGTYVLVATADGHQAGAVALGVADGPVEAELLLVRSAALRGTVTGEDGPVAGARVTLVQDGEVVDAADSDDGGAYRVEGLAAGEYAVSVAAAGCEPDIELVLLPDEAEVVHDVDLAPAAVTAGRGPDGG